MIKNMAPYEKAVTTCLGIIIVMLGIVVDQQREQSKNLSLLAVSAEGRRTKIEILEKEVDLLRKHIDTLQRDILKRTTVVLLPGRKSPENPNEVYPPKYIIKPDQRVLRRQES